MSDLFFQLGRKLGHAAIPAARKTRWAWRLFTGSESESIEAEWETGEAMARNVPLAEPGPDTTADTALLDEICGKLVARLRNQHRKFTARVVRTGGPDAFSLPGGFIFVDSALLDVCRKDPHQLAFVVAHEIAHIVRRHALDRWVAGASVNLIAALVSRGGTGAWWQQQGQALLRNAYSQNQETEADEFAFRLARAAGFDPAGSTRLLQLLDNLRAVPGRLGEHLLAHPPEAKRIAALDQVARKLERGAQA